MGFKANSDPIPDLNLPLGSESVKKEKGVANHFTFEYRPRLKSGQSVVRMAIKSRRCR